MCVYFTHFIKIYTLAWLLLVARPTLRVMCKRNITCLFFRGEYRLSHISSTQKLWQKTWCLVICLSFNLIQLCIVLIYYVRLHSENNFLQFLHPNSSVHFVKPAKHCGIARGVNMAAPFRCIYRPLWRIITGSRRLTVGMRNISFTENHFSATNHKTASVVSPWTLHGAVCLQRLPVISQDRNPIEEEFSGLMQQVNILTLPAWLFYFVSVNIIMNDFSEKKFLCRLLTVLSEQLLLIIT